jgi:hypothetical protein
MPRGANCAELKLLQQYAANNLEVVEQRHALVCGALSQLCDGDVADVLEPVGFGYMVCHVPMNRITADGELAGDGVQ